MNAGGWQVYISAETYPGFLSMKWLEVFLLHADGILIQNNINFSSVVPIIHMHLGEEKNWK